MKKILFLIFAFIILKIIVANVNAQYGQPAPSYSILVDKMVGKPFQTKGGVTDVNYVDNLSSSDPRFAPGQIVYFKIKIKNTSSSDITNVVVKDFVPSFLTPIEGPGSWDVNTRTINWNAGDFRVDEEKIYYLKMQINSQNQLPAEKGLFCLVNKVSASTAQTADDDSSQFCLEKQVVDTVKKVPSAGPEMGLALLTGQILVLSAGLFLRKKTP